MFKIIKLIIILIALILTIGYVYYHFQISTPYSSSTNQVNFNIAEGSGVKQISQNLFDQQLIKSRWWFEVYVWEKNLDHNFIPGSYGLAKNLSIRQIVNLITQPGNSEATLTIIEGWDNRDIAKYLETKKFGTSADFLNLVGKNLISYVNNYSFLADKPKDADLEGFLFPDTYRVYNNATLTEIVKKMLDNFDKKLTPQMRADILAQHKTIFEIINLASIIEKEVRTPADMKMVADVFWKRLNQGMALQSDATVNYITGKNTTRPSGADIQVDNPYNTYKYKGLPPTPIANPGLNAIKAAIYPTANPYYYFLTTSDGTVIYSKTFQEHSKNIKKYLPR